MSFVILTPLTDLPDAVLHETSGSGSGSGRLETSGSGLGSGLLETSGSGDVRIGVEGYVQIPCVWGQLGSLVYGIRADPLCMGTVGIFAPCASPYPNWDRWHTRPRRDEQFAYVHVPHEGNQAETYVRS